MLILFKTKKLCPFYLFDKKENYFIIENNYDINDYDLYGNEFTTFRLKVIHHTNNFNFGLKKNYRIGYISEGESLYKAYFSKLRGQITIDNIEDYQFSKRKEIVNNFLMSYRTNYNKNNDAINN